MFNQQKSGRDKIWPALAFLLAAAAVLCWKLSVGATGVALSEYGDIVQLRLGARSVNPPKVAEMLEKRDAESEDMRYLAWGQTESATLEGGSLGRRSDVGEALYYCGDSHGLFSLVRDNGCALSEDAAFSVFGTSEGVLGESVIFDGETYVVERLLTGGSPAAVFKLSEDNRAALDVLNAVPVNGAGFSENEVRMNYGISGDIAVHYDVVIKFFAALCRLVVWVAALVTALFLMIRLTRGLNSNARKPAVLGGVLAAAAACLLLMGSPVFIPDSFIPTRWSEFEFWSGAFTGFTGSLNYYFSMKAYVPDVLFRSLMLEALAFALLSAVCIATAGAALGRPAKGAG